MVRFRRFGPLMVAVGLALFVVLVRLFDVQVREHEVWAREAANLVRSWTVEPYRRGTIHDRDGRVLVRDQEVYEIDFVWREFRRGNPLGQLAQARSLLQMRPVPLDEALVELHEWADAFVALSPADIDLFGRGGWIDVGGYHVPATPGESRSARRDRAREERRRARSGDLQYYVQALLDLDGRAKRYIARLRGKPERKLPYLELAASRSRRSPMEESRRLHERLDAAVDDLRRLSPLLDWEEFPDVAAPSSLAALIDVIESSRREVDDATADELFRRAAGFPASRLGARNLHRLDLDWLARCLYWDGLRLEEWIEERGRLFDESVEDYLAGHAIARSKLGDAPAVTRVLSSLAHFFRPTDTYRSRDTAIPEDWRRADDVVVLAGFEERFEGGASVPPELLVNALPFQSDAVRSGGESLDGASVLALAFSGLRGLDALGERLGFEEPPTVFDASEVILRSSGTSRLTWSATEQAFVELVMKDWNARLQERVAEVFGHLPERVRLTGAWVDLAVESRPYVVRDRGARPQLLTDDPSYDLVHLVTRRAKRYAGFEVRSTARRIAMALDEEEEPLPIAQKLIGSVRAPYLVRLLEQRPREAELYQMQRKLRLAEEDRASILAHIEANYQAEEFMGGSGIEGYFDAELSGVNGYHESQGLQDRGSREPIFEPPRDGKDLYLTLDLDLQRAAQRTLEHPARPPVGEEKPDHEWLSNPVGAIVLVTPEGEVLAAASVPTRQESPPDTHQDGQRGVPIDRTLRQPLMHPPGSVIKPIVALWALENAGLSRDAGLVDCAAEGTAYTARYGKVRCHSKWGHSNDEPPVHLVTAIRKSCNAYFAFLGEQMFDEDEMVDMYSTFGFGHPTGVRCFGDGRDGLIEDETFAGPLADPEEPLLDVHRQRLANGLSHVSVTPMQIARAYCGIATGELPELSLVRSIGREPLTRRSETLPIATGHLAFMRGLLDDVVNHLAGTAHGKGLGESDLGFRLAAKTGSADYKPGPVPDYEHGNLGKWVGGMRKHTWVAGWFPSDAPEAIVVVYLHDTATTSGHGAVYLAAQFLSQPEVADYLIERGVEVKR